MKKVIGKVKAKDILVDRSYQRDIRTGRVKEMAKNFGPDEVGVLTVSLREDGNYYVIDGQHRVFAAVESGNGGNYFDCEIYVGLTVEEEAERFKYRNVNRGPVKAAEKFKAELLMGDEQAIEIDRIVNNNGLKLKLSGGARKDGEIGSINALVRVYRRGGAHELDECIRTLKSIWEGESDSLGHKFILGMFTFQKKFKGYYTDDRLERKLSPVTTTRISREAKAMTELDGSGVGTAIAKTIYKWYNNKLKTNKLPNLFASD